MRAIKQLDKSIKDSIQDIVDKYRTLCVGIKLNDSTFKYECVIYNNGVKFITGYDDMLIIAIMKAFTPMLKFVESGRVPANTQLNDVQTRQVKKMLRDLMINEPSCHVFIHDSKFS